MSMDMPIISGRTSIIGLAARLPRNITATIASIAATMITGMSTRMIGIGFGRCAAGTASMAMDPPGAGGAGSRSPGAKGSTTRTPASSDTPVASTSSINRMGWHSPEHFVDAPQPSPAPRPGPRWICGHAADLRRRCGRRQVGACREQN